MVHVESRLEPVPVPAELIQRAALAALMQQARDGGLTVVLSEDAHLRDLSNEYLGIDAPTDVLSFPAAETDPDSGENYLGDIVISVPRAELQARAAGHPLSSEIQLLVVHGVLHLLGHDHDQSPSRARMWDAQARILVSIGLGEITVREK